MWFANIPVDLLISDNPVMCGCAFYSFLLLIHLHAFHSDFVLGNCNNGDDITHFYHENKLNCTSCSANECQNGAECHVIDGINYKCSCGEKHHGKFCQFENACFENPCQHNATCMEVENTLKCNCTSGFLGERCEIQDVCYLKKTMSK